MIVVTNRIPVAKGQEAVFEDRFCGRAGLVEKRRGCRGFQLLRPLRGDAYMVMTWWDSEADFQAWTESEEFREAHRNRRMRRDLRSARTSSHIQRRRSILRPYRRVSRWDGTDWSIQTPGRALLCTKPQRPMGRLAGG